MTVIRTVFGKFSSPVISYGWAGRGFSFFIVTLILCSFFVSFSAIAQNHDYYIGNADHSIKYKIPDDIIASKDCSKYQEFVHSLVRPMFVPDDSCPWPWDKVKPVANFTLNGVNFRIPREYLSASRGVPDGTVNDIIFLMDFPQMPPSEHEKDSSRDIHIKITAATNKNYFHNDQCSEIAECFFKENIKSYSTKSDVSDAAHPVKIKEIYNTSLYNYDGDFKEGYSFEYYILGNSLKPSYWLQCAPAHRENEELVRIPRCESVFTWNKKFFVSYSFQREKLLPQQLAIRENIEKKIKEFIVQ